MCTAADVQTRVAARLHDITRAARSENAQDCKTISPAEAGTRKPSELIYRPPTAAGGWGGQFGTNRTSGGGGGGGRGQTRSSAGQAITHIRKLL